MSWSDLFPIFGDDKIDSFNSEASAADRETVEGWMRVKQAVNPREGAHIVASSLFWKNPGIQDGDLPPITRESLMRAKALGLVSRFAPWEHYVEPLIKGAKELALVRPDVVFRVYLASDLDFLIEDLVEAGCEVKLMESSSIRHNPGAMWRFLALEEKGKWVTITDADRAEHVVHDVDRTEHIMRAGFGAWRVPYVFDWVRAGNNPGYYRPIIACQFGAAGGVNVGEIAKAFLWRTLQRTMPNKYMLPDPDGSITEHEIFGTKWPTYGFDEWFLLAAVYPRLAFEGILTFLPRSRPIANQAFALDIEYVTWASAKSEILYFDEEKKEEEKECEAENTGSHCSCCGSGASDSHQEGTGERCSCLVAAEAETAPTFS